MANLPVINYLSKDYEGFRAELINIIPALLPEWTDYSESDPGIAIVELLSYGMDILSYYQDRQANEVYPATATQKQSIIEITRMIGYRLKTAIPATTTLVFTITVQDTDYKIPKGFQISTQSTSSQPAILFETDRDLIIPANKVGNEKDVNSKYLYTVTATQGQTISNEILGSSNNQPNQKFTLKNPNIIIDGPQGSSLNVSVNSGSGAEIWTDVTDSIQPYTDTGKQYTWIIDASGILKVIFGDGSSGTIPASGTNNITSTYRIGGGLIGNVGSGTITIPVTTAQSVRTVTNTVSATGGVDVESIDHARVQAPLQLRTSLRAVTAQDYATLTKSMAGIALAKAFTKTNVANTVYLTIAPTGGGQPSQALTDSVYSHINDLKTITTTVVMQNPKYLNARTTINATVFPSYSNSQTQTLIQQTLNSAMNFVVRDFGLGQYVSYLYQILNQVSGIKYLSIDRFTVNPRVDTIQSTGNPTFSSIVTNSGHTFDGLWKVQMTSATAFTVSYNPSGDGVTWVQDGTGTFGAVYNSVLAGNRITFTITAGNVAAVSGDYWTFRTSNYLGNIDVAQDEILLLDIDVVINVVGGIA